MASFFLFFCCFISLCSSALPQPQAQAQTQTCASYAFSNGRFYQSCNDLPFLSSFLHWNYHPSTATVDVAYRHTNISSSAWVAWAINPTSEGMTGSQALVAFHGTDGNVRSYTSPVTAYNTKLEEGNLSFPVSTISAEFVNNAITIFATLELPNNSTKVHHVWQEGPLINGNTPGIHSVSGANVQSMGTLDFLSGQMVVKTTPAGNSRLKRRYVHGVLNAVSWGIMMPVGAIIARYLKVFKFAGSAWFYIHVTCQCSAYIVGVAGWATGLVLGNESTGIQYSAHRIIGMVLFCLATLQVFALILRPKPDHKYRFYWNIYHQLTGYTVIILSIVNVFKGFDILDPEKKWKQAYIGVLLALGAIAVLLEILSWVIVIKRKRSADKSQEGTKETNELNGNAVAREQVV